MHPKTGRIGAQGQHAQVIVNAAFADQLHLSGIPKRVVSLASLKFLQSIKVLAIVFGVFQKRFLRPVRQGFVFRCDAR